jgi:hypothetical protein
MRCGFSSPLPILLSRRCLVENQLSKQIKELLNIWTIPFGYLWCGITNDISFEPFRLRLCRNMYN